MFSRGATITPCPDPLLARLRVALLAGALFACCGPALGAEIVVEGAAPLRDGNVAEAREAAIRNALAEAARSAELRVEARSGAGVGETPWERTAIRAAASVRRHEVLDQRVDGDVLRVRLRADLSAGEDAAGLPCGGHLRRILIGGFPLERPEQLLPDELDGYARLTARELAQRIGAQRTLLVDHDGRLMLRDGFPERVVGDLPPDAQAWQQVRAAAREHRAQYLLVGLFRSLALGADRQQRALELDALLIDGLSGSCVARARFSRSAAGRVVLPKFTPFGGPVFYASDLGRAYGDLLDDVAAWAGAQASCLPFTARVLKVDGNAVYLDAGAEQSVSPGDAFAAFRVDDVPLRAASGELLGVEKKPAGELTVRHVYPRFAIGELTGRVAGRNRLEAGDELHFR